MWIRTTRGNYINSDKIFSISLVELQSGDISVTADAQEKGFFVPIAIFSNKAEAQEFLDKFMKHFGTIARASMGDWNYTGHKKDRKETRHGGS